MECSLPVRDLSVFRHFSLCRVQCISRFLYSIRQNKVYHAFLRTEMNEYLLVRLELFVADGVTVLNDGIDKQGGAKTCLRIFGSLSPAVFIMNQAVFRVVCLWANCKRRNTCYPGRS